MAKIRTLSVWILSLDPIWILSGQDGTGGRGGREGRLGEERTGQDSDSDRTGQDGDSDRTGQGQGWTGQDMSHRTGKDEYLG